LRNAGATAEFFVGVIDFGVVLGYAYTTSAVLPPNDFLGVFTSCNGQRLHLKKFA